MAVVWHRLPVEEVEAGLQAADVLPVWWWWLEERQRLLVKCIVKTVEVCQSVGSSSQIEDF